MESTASLKNCVMTHALHCSVIDSRNQTSSKTIRIQNTHAVKVFFFNIYVVIDRVGPASQCFSIVASQHNTSEAASITMFCVDHHK